VCVSLTPLARRSCFPAATGTCGAQDLIIMSGDNCDSDDEGCSEREMKKLEPVPHLG
jgi:hypothetical protein